MATNNKMARVWHDRHQHQQQRWLTAQEKEVEERRMLVRKNAKRVGGVEDDPLPPPAPAIRYDPLFVSQLRRQGGNELFLLEEEEKDQELLTRNDHNNQIWILKKSPAHQTPTLLQEQALYQHREPERFLEEEEEKEYVTHDKKAEVTSLLRQQERKEQQQRTVIDHDPMEQKTIITNKQGAGQAPPTEQQEKTQSEKKPSRLKQVFTTTDWWSLWIGLASFAIATFMVFVIPFNKATEEEEPVAHKRGIPDARYIVPQPKTWDANPLEAWTLYGVAGTIVLHTIMGGLYMASLYAMNKLKVAEKATQYILGFSFHSLIATLAFWLGRQRWLSQNGLGYAIWSIVLGIFLGNVVLPKTVLDFLKPTFKDGEFFIKCSLVLLAVEFRVLSRVGLPALVVSWIGSPLVLFVSYYFIGIRLLKMERRPALLIVTGATWCGASAISAVGSVTHASSRDISLSISIVAAFTVVFTFAQAYFALAVGMNHEVAGAWIGGSVDQTGNVIASAAILSEEATEVAGIVKIVLNSGLGILASVIACWWSTKGDNDNDNDNDEEQQQQGNNDASRQQASSSSKASKFSLLFLWDKFPKFVLGYLLCSSLLSIILPAIRDTPQESAYVRAIQSWNRWWFAIAFVGIGLGTHLKELWQGARRSGMLQLYLISNMLDIVVALGLAYAVF